MQCVDIFWGALFFSIGIIAYIRKVARTTKNRSLSTKWLCGYAWCDELMVTLMHQCLYLWFKYCSNMKCMQCEVAERTTQFLLFKPALWNF